MKTMLLWLMIQPGVWESYVDVYKDAAECQKAYAFLVSLQPVYKLNNLERQRKHLRTIYFEGSKGSGIMFTGCH